MPYQPSIWKAKKLKSTKSIKILPNAWKPKLILGPTNPRSEKPKRCVFALKVRTPFSPFPSPKNLFYLINLLSILIWILIKPTFIKTLSPLWKLNFLSFLHSLSALKNPRKLNHEENHPYWRWFCTLRGGSAESLIMVRGAHVWYPDRNSHKI